MNKLIALPAALAALMLAPLAQAQDAAKLAQDKACLSCHQVDKKLVGPSFKEIAAKYRADKGANATLVKAVRAGSQGKWGQVPMPPNASVSEKEAQLLVKWIMSQK
jgi:cytochrome c